MQRREKMRDVSNALMKRKGGAEKNEEQILSGVKALPDDRVLD